MPIYELKSIEPKEKVDARFRDQYRTRIHIRAPIEQTARECADLFTLQGSHRGIGSLEPAADFLPYWGNRALVQCGILAEHNNVAEGLPKLLLEKY